MGNSPSLEIHKLRPDDPPGCPRRCSLAGKEGGERLFSVERL